MADEVRGTSEGVRPMTAVELTAKAAQGTQRTAHQQHNDTRGGRGGAACMQGTVRRKGS